MKAVVTSLFIVLLILSFVYAYERILFADASFILFRIINYGSLQIQELRVGSFITQLIPLLAARLHLPLTLIVFLYSASFNLFYLAVALLLLFVFREISLAVLMSLYYILFVSDTFYWANNEVHQGTAWLFLAIAVFNDLYNKKAALVIQLTAFLVLMSLAVFTHPLIMMPAFFLWLFLLSENNNWQKDKTKALLFSGVLMIICLLKFLLSKTQSYDGEKLHAITHLSFTDIKNALQTPMIKEMAKRMLTNYWLVPLLFGVGIYSGLRKKRLFTVYLSITACIIYILLLCITYNDFQAFYTESEWMPLTIILAAPFVYYTLPQLKPKAANAILIAIYLLRLSYIIPSAEKFTARIKWHNTIFNEMNKKSITKAFILETPAIKNTLLLSWATPAESIIASALNRDKPNRTFIIEKEENLKQFAAINNTQMIAPFEIIPASSLNPFYFSLDTTTTYKYLH